MKNYECSIPLDIVEFFQAPLQVYGVRYKTAIRRQMMTLVLTGESTNILISVSVLEFFLRVSQFFTSKWTKRYRLIRSESFHNCAQRLFVHEST